MARVIPSKMTAELDGDFVVFLIGMRINKPWKIHKWLPVFLAMPPILKELDALSLMRQDGPEERFYLVARKGLKGKAR